MASILNGRDGNLRIMFRDGNKARRSLSLGACERRHAEVVAQHVDHILNAKMLSLPIPRPTIAWLGSIERVMSERLIRCGLIQSAVCQELGSFLDEYVLRRRDVKPSTIEVWRQTAKNLTDFFGRETKLRDITQGSADRFKEHLTTDSTLAQQTVAKRLSLARTFFQSAVRNSLIEENPFRDVTVAAGGPNAGRQFFVASEAINRVLDAAPVEWQHLLVLARYAGLRCPSEIAGLQWRHLDHANLKIVVKSPKTARYAGKASRDVPMFPRVAAHFQNHKGDPDQYIVGERLRRLSYSPKTGVASSAIRGEFEKLLDRTGVARWPKLFQNLRASLETELLDRFPVHVVARWMGHSPQVSMKNYAQVVDDHWIKATVE